MSSKGAQGGRDTHALLLYGFLLAIAIIVSFIFIRKQATPENVPPKIGYIGSTRILENANHAPVANSPEEGRNNAILDGDSLTIQKDASKFLSQFTSFHFHLESLPPHERVREWRRWLRDVQKNCEPVEFVQRLNLIQTEMSDLCRQTKLDENKNLWDELLYSVAPIPSDERDHSFQSMLSKLPESILKQSLNIATIKRRITSQPLAAVENLKSITDPQVRALVEPEALRNLVHKSRKDALLYFLSSECQAFTDPSIQNRVVMDFLKYRPEEASTIIRDQPASARKDTAVAVLINAYANSDTEAAKAWLGQLSDAAKASELRLLVERAERRYFDR